MADQVRVGLGAVAARDRDVELGIAPHAVLGDVQPGRLDLGLDPDPHSAFIAQSDPNDAVNVNTPTASSPSAWVPSWSKLPVYQSLPCPVARFSASAGTAKIPVASVPQTPAIPWTATAPIGSSIRMRSTSRTPSDGDPAGDEPDDDRRPGRDEAGRRGHGDEGGDHAVQHHREVGLPQHEPRRR